MGEFCEHTNPCLTAKCQNDGTCDVTLRDGQPSFQCKCPIGFSGSLCEFEEQTACSSSPCRNNGKCTLKSLREYECKCPEGFSGNFRSPLIIMLNEFQFEFSKFIVSRGYWKLLACLPVLTSSSLFSNVALCSCTDLLCYAIMLSVSFHANFTYTTQKKIDDNLSRLFWCCSFGYLIYLLTFFSLPKKNIKISHRKKLWKAKPVCIESMQKWWNLFYPAKRKQVQMHMSCWI